jgi:mannose-6-phosphate isomerase-like protein (cupin superfamily)
VVVWWNTGAGVHVEPHRHANEQIVWLLKGKIEFRLGTEPRVFGPGDVMVIPGGSEEHEAWFHKDTEVIDGAIAAISGSSILLWRLQFLLY